MHKNKVVAGLQYRKLQRGKGTAAVECCPADNIGGLIMNTNVLCTYMSIITGTTKCCCLGLTRPIISQTFVDGTFVP